MDKDNREHFSVISTPIGTFTTLGTSTATSLIASVILVIVLALLYFFWKRRE